MASIISAGTSAGTAIAISGDTTGNLAFQTQAGANTITVPNAAGAIMVSGNMPAFGAYRATTQSLSSGVFTKIQLNTEEFDTASCYDNATNYRFTPLVAGYYQISGGWQNNANSSFNYVLIYKNGSAYKNNSSNGANGTGSVISALIYFNGSTDYVELYAFTDAGAIAGSSSNTIFTGCLMRSA
jgi:hypothetical protein